MFKATNICNNPTINAYENHNLFVKGVPVFHLVALDDSMTPCVEVVNSYSACLSLALVCQVSI